MKPSQGGQRGCLSSHNLGSDKVRIQTDVQGAEPTGWSILPCLLLWIHLNKLLCIWSTQAHWPDESPHFRYKATGDPPTPDHEKTNNFFLWTCTYTQVQIKNLIPLKVLQYRFDFRGTEWFLCPNLKSIDVKTEKYMEAKLGWCFNYCGTAFKMCFILEEIN